MILNQLVEKYRNGDSDLYHLLVIELLPVIDKLIYRYVTAQHSYLDLREIAYYELVCAVLKAQDSLEDNNITTYVCSRVHFALRKYKRGKPYVYEQRDLEQTLFTTDNAIENVALQDLLDKCIKDDLQKQVVELKLSGESFQRIVEIVGILSLHHVRLRWFDFLKCFAEVYHR